MTENLFVSTACFPDNTPLSKVLGEFEDSPFQNLELGSNHSHEKNYVELLKKYKFNYIVHNYFPIPEDNFVLNLATANDSIRKRSIEHGITALELSHDIGSALYTVHPGFLVDPISANKDSSNYDFVFGETSGIDSLYEKSYEFMIQSLEILIKRATELNVDLAIETEGSFNKHDILLMQKPEEFIQLFEHFKSEELKINLNMGHLNLAAKKFKFSRNKFCKLVSPYVSAIELSHNEGVNDDHAPITENGWYWELINKKEFIDKIKIFEFRDTGIDQIKKSLDIFKNKTRVN